jgi:hypothetical protein
MHHTRVPVLSFATMLVATAAFAQDWRHASAPMGQYEGGISLDTDSYGAYYGCAGSFGNLTFFAKGVHVGAGESVIRVDGREVARGNTQYNSVPDDTRFSIDVQHSFGPAGWTRYNELILAIAAGAEALWETPTGEVFIFPLSGSAQIRSCLME